MVDVVALLAEFEEWRGEQDYPEGTPAERFAQYREDRWNLTKLCAIEALVKQHGWDVQAFETIMESEYGDEYVISLIEEDGVEGVRTYIPVAEGGIISDKSIEYITQNL